MKRQTMWLSVSVFVLLPVFASKAQDASSRLIPFSLSTTLQPQTTQEVVVQLWDASSGGALIFDESYTGRDALAVPVRQQTHREDDALDLGRKLALAA